MLEIVYMPRFIRAHEETTLETLEINRREYETYQDNLYSKRPCRAWSIIQDWHSLEVFLVVGYDNDNDFVTLMEWPYSVDDYEIKWRYEEIVNGKLRNDKVVHLKEIQDYMVLLQW